MDKEGIVPFLMCLFFVAAATVFLNERQNASHTLDNDVYSFIQQVFTNY